MSLILKGIDMPKGTDGLSITFHSQDGVTETHILDVTQTIQIPKGHGSIADASTIAEAIKKSPVFASKYKETAAMYIKIYGGREAILEAEE